MRTNAVFSRFALVSYFYTEIKVLGKFWKNSKKSYLAEVPRSQKGSCGRSPQPPGATWPRPSRGRAWAPPGHLEARPTTLLSPTYFSRPKNARTPNRFCRKVTEHRRLFETQFGEQKFLFRHPSGTGFQGRSSPSPPPLHRPSMFPPFPSVG